MMVMLPDCVTPATFYAIVDLDGMPKLDTRVTDAQVMHAVYMRMGSDTESTYTNKHQCEQLQGMQLMASVVNVRHTLYHTLWIKAFGFHFNVAHIISFTIGIPSIAFIFTRFKSRVRFG
ncbi:hypothetical protein [Hoylesella shahii]|uniref:hypothetical protein n=1 Tax=Hoylesella shahii TaxID=228603 RepID=UPI0028E93A04|nr:hypothetical protein [Hoylesella shahii]